MKVLNTSITWLRELFSGRAPDLTILLLTTALLSAIMSSVLLSFDQPLVYSQGEIASRTVRAPHDLMVEDALSTEKRRAEAIANVKFVFSANPERIGEPSLHLSYLFSAVREVTSLSPEKHAPAPLSQENRSQLERRFHLDLVGPEWDLIAQPSRWPQLETAVLSIVRPIVAKGIIANKRSLHRALEMNQAVLRERDNKREEPIESENAFYDLAEARAKAISLFPARGFGKGAVFDSVARKLSDLVLQPNIIFDDEETERRFKQARDDVNASTIRVQRGQVIVREGELVTLSQSALLAQFKGESHPRPFLQIFAAYWLLAITIVTSLYMFALNYWPGFKLTRKDSALLAISLIASFGLLRAFFVLGNALGYSFPYIDSDSFLLATPLAACGLLLQPTLGPAAVLFYTFLFSLLTGVFLEDSWLVLLLIGCGNLVGAIRVQTCSRRSTFIYAGVSVAGVNMLLTLCYLLFYPETSMVGNLAMLLFAMLGGIMSGILAGGFAPFVEYFGGYITDIKLLELASLDRPLLRELSLQAPGTWNHSMVMGQIAEAASEAIGANPLLTRVGAYYHDIGKVSKPAYFVENQGSRESRHDKLTPSMSALIIKSHVKEGIELALEHRLPQALVDFIPQHHGNSRIDYFYDKAVKEAEPGEIVDESHYRYPGPRPQTKEAGILMLADAVEASSRTLSEATPAKIQGLVQKIINKVFASGELDECDLTLQDLHFIAKSFTRVLTGIYHRRVEYSEPAEKVRDFRPAKPKVSESEEEQLVDAAGRAPSETESIPVGQDTVSPEGTPQENEEPLKRLGMH